MGFTVTVIRGRGPTIDVWTTDSRLAIETLSSLDTKVPVSPILSRQLVSVARRWKPDFILVRDIFLAGYALHVGSVLDLPCCVDVADNYPEVLWSIWPQSPRRELLVRMLNIWERYVLRRATAFITVTEESKEHLISKHRLKGSRIFILENVPEETTVWEVYTGPFMGRLVYIGTYDRGIRDLDTVISGLSLYRSIYGECVTLTLYTFNVEEAKCLLRNHPGADQLVTVLPAGPSAELRQTLHGFDAGVIPHSRCPATEYTVPNKLFDYLYSGIGVIASNTPPLRRIIGELGGGVTYSCGDPKDFARSLRRLKGKTEEGKNRVNVDLLVSKYNWNNQVRPFIDFLGYILQNRCHKYP